jgi:heme/copper-type cytochrome/quinol oxidase subunit 3
MLDNSVMKKLFLLEKHKYHLVTNSPWPFLMSLSVLYLTFSGILYMQYIKGASHYLFFNFFLICICFIGWWHNIILESTYEGHHTKKVQENLSMGMILFILSEVMFFVSFFGSYFYLTYPYPEAFILDRIWPSIGLILIDPWKLPFLNTLILLLSGFYLTCAHYELKLKNYNNTLFFLTLVIILGLFFTCIQYFEYKEAFFSISDGIYGSLFYLLTGFHGFHVLVGTIFLIVCFFRLFLWHFTDTHHLGFEFAIWYWHFVDVIWLFLFLIIYNQNHVFSLYELI